MSSSGIVTAEVPATKMSWETAAKDVREAIDKAIPQKWKLQGTLKIESRDVRDIPRTCGLLSSEELHITEQTATDLVKKLASGELSSSQVVEAFCARAAVAHQLVSSILPFTLFLETCAHLFSCKVNCLTAFFPEEALQRAAELDEHLRRVGKPVGPLHGLPVAIKVRFDSASSYIASC